MKNSLVGLSVFFLASASSLVAAQENAGLPKSSNLLAGVAKVDITPKDVVGMKVTGHSREVTGVRDPLRAGVLVLDDGETRAAIVTMDTIGAWEDMVRLARMRIEEVAKIPAANILIAASHNHSGPGYDDY